MDTIDNTRIFFIQKILPLIKESNNKKLILILKEHHFLNSNNALNGTFLHYSVEHCNEEVTQYLLDQGYYANVQDSTGITPLMLAVRRKHKATIETLLTAGADITMLNHENKSVLHMICETHNVKLQIRKLILCQLPKLFSSSEEIAQVLIDASCHLYQAAYLENAKVLEYMLERGFAVNSKNPTTQQTVLHIACSLENVDSVKLLLQYGAKVDAMDRCGSTPIHYVYQLDKQHTHKKLELLQILLSAQALLTSCNIEGLFQISSALVNGNDRAISMLLQKNIDFTAKDKIYGASVLHYLAINKNPGVVDQLKLHINKYDVNVTDDFGLNSLYVAVAQANVVMVEFLLSQGATPNCTHSLYGYTPLHYAYSRFEPGMEEQIEKCVELLLQYNADPQRIVTEENKQITIFDIAPGTNNVNCLKSVIGHLVLHQGLGVPITDISYSKIDSCQPRKEYFTTCQELLGKKICGSITLFKLLADEEKKMARYFNNEELVHILTNSNYLQNLKSLHSYYYNSLVKRLSKGIQYNRFFRKLATVISEISEDRFDRRHLIVDKIINCFDNETLKQLYQLSKMT